MATRRVGQCFQYATPQAVIDAAPDGFVYRHFAFFDRYTTRWTGEVAGYVPYPDLPRHLACDRRQRFLAQWQHASILGLGSRYEILDELWDSRIASLSLERMASKDVTHYQWPIGDHVYHRLDPIDGEIRWNNDAGRKFIEIDRTTLNVVAQAHSHRQIRDAVPSQHVLDITGTAFELFWGWIWGRFVRRGDRWGFEPRVVRRRGRVDALVTAPEPVRRQLAEAPIDLDLFQDRIHDTERIPVWPSPTSSLQRRALLTRS